MRTYGVRISLKTGPARSIVQSAGDNLSDAEIARAMQVAYEAAEASRRAHAAADIIARAIPDPAWRQSIANSQVLARNLGIEIGSGLNAHHIVAGTHRRAQDARQLLDHYQIDINAAENGVGLVGGTGAPQNILPRHHRGNGLHTFDGIDAVTDRLRQTVEGIDDWNQGRMAIIAELSRLRQQILNGIFP